jgi:hypothetical protein
MEAIVRWVEDGKAPDKLMAERRDLNGKSFKPRPLSTDEAANFASRTPAQ